MLYVSSVYPLPAPAPRDTPPLLARLVDDAALFPPGNATMPEAVQRHIEGLNGKYSGVIGALLCPASRLPELITELSKAKPDQPVALSLVIDTGLGGVPKAVSIVESRTELLRLHAVEMPAPSDVDEIWLERVDEFVPEDALRVIEPRRGGVGWLDGVRKVTERGYRPKIRCGGPNKENFPSIDEIAEFLAVVSDTGSAYKATTGLYSAVRRADPDTGVVHHGFLNLLVATARALSGEDVRAALGSDDGPALAEEATTLSETDTEAVRAVFASYGSCSLSDPVADLETLGLL